MYLSVMQAVMWWLMSRYVKIASLVKYVVIVRRSWRIKMPKKRKHTLHFWIPLNNDEDVCYECDKIRPHQQNNRVSR
jgi:hypothetical protein